MRRPSYIPCCLFSVALGCCHSFMLRPDRVPSSKDSACYLSSQSKLSATRASTATDSTTATDNDNPLASIKELTTIAIFECGTDVGLEALRELSQLCQHRIPFDFDKHGSSNNDDNNDERLISYFPSSFPQQDRDDFLKIVQRMEANQWLSQNPDSVDGLPSLHLNLVSGAKPLFSAEDNDDEDEFENGIRQLCSIIEPYVYDVLLPKVKEELSTDTTPASEINLRVSDVFLRRYGQDICGGDRNGISAHYDVFSKVTAVIALDDVAKDGRNGLFTTVVDEKTGETSNHKAMRRFFPLQAGDAVVHTWNVLHGVDVEQGLDRTSLIVWFDEFPESDKDNDNEGISPWLARHPDLKDSTENDVLHFVLASAISSAEEGNVDLPSPVELYLDSAARRNTFALTRMGSLCEEGALDDPALQSNARRVLESLRPRSSLPSMVQNQFKSDNPQQELAIRFWLEGAIGGSPLAQKALADELMMISSQTNDEDGRLLAAVLFSLAAQQDDEGAAESLSRVIEFDIASREIDSEEAFLASPVVQVAKAATANAS